MFNELNFKNTAGIIRKVWNSKNFLNIDIDLLNTHNGNKYINDKKIGLDITLINKKILLANSGSNGYMEMSTDNKNVLIYSIIINNKGVSKIIIY